MSENVVLDFINCQNKKPANSWLWRSCNKRDFQHFCLKTGLIDDQNSCRFIFCRWKNWLIDWLLLSTQFFIHRYLFVSVGGCVLAVVTMGIYSALLFTSTFVFILLVCSVDPSSIHAWVFGMQMLWQTFWHLLIQYREYYLHEPVCIR